MLAAETRRIRDAGTPVLALRPTPADAAAFRTAGGGVDRPSVAEQAYRSVTERLEADPALLAQLVEPVAVHP
ncbi:MAG: hypothetical protein R2755_04295 [Acidimicrobiales bacterium]